MEQQSFIQQTISKVGRILAFLLFSLLIVSCATRGGRGSDTKELEDFEDFEDAFTRAAEESIVGNYIGKGRQSNLILYFDYNSAYLALDGRIALDREIAKIAAVISNNKKSNLVVRVIGHTDERGSDEYNLALGQRRANSVARYMMTKGIPRERMQAVSYGEKIPIATTRGEAAWAENRRVELIY